MTPAPGASVKVLVMAAGLSSCAIAPMIFMVGGWPACQLATTICFASPADLDESFSGRCWRPRRSPRHAALRAGAPGFFAGWLQACIGCLNFRYGLPANHRFRSSYWAHSLYGYLHVRAGFSTALPPPDTASERNRAQSDFLCHGPAGWSRPSSGRNWPLPTVRSALRVSLLSGPYVGGGLPQYHRLVLFLFFSTIPKAPLPAR